MVAVDLPAHGGSHVIRGGGNVGSGDSSCDSTVSSAPAGMGIVSEGQGGREIGAMGENESKSTGISKSGDYSSSSGDVKQVAGSTSGAATLGLGIEWLAGAAVNLAVGLGYDDVILVGYSMGARVAMAAAAAAPELVGRLVLLAGNPGLEGEAERRQRAAVDAQLAKVRRWFSVVRMPLQSDGGFDNQPRLSTTRAALIRAAMQCRVMSLRVFRRAIA